MEQEDKKDWGVRVQATWTEGMRQSFFLYFFVLQYLTL